MPPKTRKTPKLLTAEEPCESAGLDDDPDMSEGERRIVDAIKMDIERMKAEFVAILTKKNGEITALKSEITTLRDRVSVLEKKADDIDAHERKDTLVFSGDEIPQVTVDENCSEVIRGIVKNQLRLEISSNDISSAFRLGKAPITQKSDRRNIIVKLCRKDLKRDILSACRRMKPKFYANESLTPLRNTILYVLRKMRRLHNNRIRGCSSFDGKVCAWVRQPGASADTRDVPVFINNRDKLASFCRQHTGEELSKFIDNWPH